MSSETEAGLERAMLAHLEAEGLLDEGAMMGDWITVIHLPAIQGGGSYASLMTRGSRAPHTARGLLEIGHGLVEESEADE